MIKLPYRHFVWDFDGMLFDSYDHTTQAALRTLHDSGRDEPWQEIYNALRVSVGVMCKNYSFDEDMRKRFNRYEADLSMLPVTRPYPGITTLLRKITADGGNNYLLTNRDKLGGVYLEKNGVRDCFTEIVDASFGFPRKPDPKGMLYLKEKYGFAGDALMLGDRELDIEAGLGGGADGCFFDEFKRNLHSKAKYRVYTIKELYKLIFGEEMETDDK